MLADEDCGVVAVMVSCGCVLGRLVLVWWSLVCLFLVLMECVDCTEGGGEDVMLVGAGVLSVVGAVMVFWFLCRLKVML